MAILATQNKVLTVPSKTFDKWWVWEMESKTILKDNIPKSYLRVKLKRFRWIDEQAGTIELETNEPTVMFIEDVYKDASTDTDVASTLTAFLGGIVVIGTKKNIL